MFSETTFGERPESEGTGSLRSPPISQGEVTIHGLISLAGMQSRKKRSQNARDNSVNGQPSHVIPGAESDNNLIINPHEPLFVIRGIPGLVNNKLNVFSSFSGLAYSTLEDLASQLLFVGTAKNGYNPFSTKTPQYGVAIRFKGIENLQYTCNPEKPVPIYPGEFLRFSVPKYNKRTIPHIDTAPAEKIVPIIEPFSFSALAQYTESISKQAYSSKLATLPLTSSYPGSRPGLGVGVDSRYNSTIGQNETLTPFQRLAQNEKTAEIVNALRVLEPLIVRGAITVNVTGDVFKQRNTSYSKILKAQTPQQIKKTRESIFHLATLLGLVGGDLLLNDEEDDDDIAMNTSNDPRVNEAQKDVFMMSKYPRVPAELVDLYHPNINFGNVKGASMQLSLRESKKLEKENHTYVQLCQSAREARDVTKAETERAELSQICGMNMTYCNPHNVNPRSDLYITHGGFV